MLTHLPSTLQNSVRMGFLHSSRPVGRIPAALKAAAEVRFVGVRSDAEDQTIVTFRVPRFKDAAPSLFEQGTFWDDTPPAEATAFDLLGAALHDIAGQRSDSSHFDLPLLKHLGIYGRLLNQGIERIGLEGSVANAPRIDREVLQHAGAMARSTPPPRRVRVAGRLDLMGASQGVLKIHVRAGVVVTALWNGAEPIERHRDLFNQDVIIEGLGVFRPSGSLLRIEADALRPAGVQDEFFRELPKAVPVADSAIRTLLRPGEKSAFAAIRGAVPAEESDEDFAAAVEEFS